MNVIVPSPKMVSLSPISFIKSVECTYLLYWHTYLIFPESYFEVELVNRLQTVVEKQRGQIKKIEQSNIEFKSDNEEVISKQVP